MIFLQKEVQDLLRHKNIEIAMIYMNLMKNMLNAPKSPQDKINYMRGKRKINKKSVSVFFIACFFWGVLPQQTFSEQVSARHASTRLDAEFLSEDGVKAYSDVMENTVSFLNRQSSPATGLIESFSGTSKYYYLPDQEVFYQDKEGYLDNQCFTYDLALAVIIYAVNGEREKAREILRVLREDFYREKNAGIGLYNSYLTDKLSPEKWLCPGIDGDRIHVGPNIWVAIAGLHYMQAAGDASFLEFAIDVAKWANELEHYKFPDADRGTVCMGSGWGPDWSQTYSTENSFVYWAFLQMLLDIYHKGTPQVKAVFRENGFTGKNIRDEIAALKKWFKERAYNSAVCGFNCGMGEDGIDDAKALDTVTNAILALGPGTLAEWGINPFQLVEFAETYLQVTDTVNGQKIEGFDFTVPQELGNPRQRLIWLEGTAQMVVAYKVMSKYALSKSLSKKAQEYKDKAVKFSLELGKISDLEQLPAHVLSYSSAAARDKERILSFKTEWEIPRGDKGRMVGCVSSTVWRCFSVLDFNPLQINNNAEDISAITKTM